MEHISHKDVASCHLPGTYPAILACHGLELRYNVSGQTHPRSQIVGCMTTISRCLSQLWLVNIQILFPIHLPQKNVDPLPNASLPLRVELHHHTPLQCADNVPGAKAAKAFSGVSPGKIDLKPIRIWIVY